MTHLAIFREPHKSGKLHFHACCLSARVRWLPWKRALLKHKINANFNHVELQGIAKQRQRQYESMLKYCWVPSRAKPLCCLDPEPLLYHCTGDIRRSWTPYKEFWMLKPFLCRSNRNSFNVLKVGGQDLGDSWCLGCIGGCGAFMAHQIFK